MYITFFITYLITHLVSDLLTCLRQATRNADLAKDLAALRLKIAAEQKAKEEREQQNKARSRLRTDAPRCDATRRDAMRFALPCATAQRLRERAFLLRLRIYQLRVVLPCGRFVGLAAAQPSPARPLRAVRAASLAWRQRFTSLGSAPHDDSPPSDACPCASPSLPPHRATARCHPHNGAEAQRTCTALPCSECARRVAALLLRPGGEGGGVIHDCGGCSHRAGRADYLLLEAREERRRRHRSAVYAGARRPAPAAREWVTFAPPPPRPHTFFTT